MSTFTFRADTLFAEAAAVSAEDELHDAPGTASHLAKIKPFAVWLRSELASRGLAAKGPFLDEGGWIVEFPAHDESAICIISGHSADESLFSLLVMALGDETSANQIIDATLQGSDRITHLSRAA